MPGLTVNGVSVPALMDRGVTRSAPELIGPSDERSFQGDLLTAIRARKEVLDLRLSLQDPATATAWRRWLLGLGDSWNFNDATFGLYSSKGRAPQAGYGASVGTTAPAPKWGARRLAVSTSIIWTSLGFRGWDATLDGRTVILWRWDGAAWKHHIIRDDWLMWVDGVTSQVATPWLFVETIALAGDYLNLESNAAYEATIQAGYAAGQVYAEEDRVRVTAGPTTYLWRCVEVDDPGETGVGGNLGGGSAGLLQYDNGVGNTYRFILEGTDPGVGAGNAYYDDAIYLPFRLPTAWTAEVYAEHAARAWSALPALRVSGEALDGRAVYMEGQLQDAGIRPAAINGSWSQGVQDVGAILREV